MIGKELNRKVLVLPGKQLLASHCNKVASKCTARRRAFWPLSTACREAVRISKRSVKRVSYDIAIRRYLPPRRTLVQELIGLIQVKQQKWTVVTRFCHYEETTGNKAVPSPEVTNSLIVPSTPLKMPTSSLGVMGAGKRLRLGGSEVRSRMLRTGSFA